MAKGHPQAVRTELRRGVQNRLRHSTTIVGPGSGANRLGPISSGYATNGGGDRGPSKGGCNRASSRLHPRVLLLPFSISKKGGGGGKTGDQPETVERTHTKETLSYDNHQGSEPVNLPGRLDHYDRPAGRFPTCTYAQGQLQVSTICMGQENVSIPQTAVRTDVISSGIHGHYNAPGGILQNQGHQSDILSGRYSGYGEHPYVALPTQRLCFETPTGCGFQTKSEEVPIGTVTEFLIPRPGMEYDTDAISLPLDKLDQIRKMISEISRTPTLKTRDCMVLLGKRNFATIAIPLARLHCRPLQFCLPRRMQEMSYMDSQMTLSREARVSLRWWTSPLLNGRSLQMNPPTQVISTNASLSGWGAQMKQVTIQGLWTDTDKFMHINYLELKTVLFALQHWLPQLENQTVSLQLDNTRF